MSKNKQLKFLPSWVGHLACQVSAHENSRNGVTGHAAERGRSGWKSRQALYRSKCRDRNTGKLSPAADGASPWALGAGTPPLGALLSAMLGGVLLGDAPAPSSPWPKAPRLGHPPCLLLPGMGVPSTPGAGPAPPWPRWRSRPFLSRLAGKGAFFGLCFCHLAFKCNGISPC